MDSTNLYFKGRTIKFIDGREVLLRDKLEYIPSGDDKFYIVKEDDKLTDLAFRFYNESKEWWIIADANNIHLPWDLPMGLKIVIPNKNLIDISL